MPGPYPRLADGTQTATTAAAALNGGVSLKVASILIQNDPASTVNVVVGNSTSQHMVLVPGDAEELSVDDVSEVFVATPSGTATVNWHAERVNA